jgi:hypothetical protein
MGSLAAFVFAISVERGPREVPPVPPPEPQPMWEREIECVIFLEEPEWFPPCPHHFEGLPALEMLEPCPDRFDEIIASAEALAP